MIKNAVLHLNNEQPLIADLFEVPGPTDVGVRCTNLRTLNGKRPVFADDIDSVFFFPYMYVRFVEIPPAAAAETGLPMPVPVATTPPVELPAEATEPEGDLELDEDFLRRIREV